MDPELSDIPKDANVLDVLKALREYKSMTLLELSSLFPGKDEEVQETVEMLKEKHLVRVSGKGFERILTAKGKVFELPLS
jgi:predicted transcriptional regulator